MAKRVIFILALILFGVGANIFEVGAQDSTKSESVTTIVGNPSGGSSPTPGGGRSGFKYYCQKDERYNDSCAYAWAICGPTSLAMVMSSFGVDMTPKDVDLVFNQNGWRKCGNEASLMEAALQSKWLIDQGFKVVKLSGDYAPLDLNLAKEALDSGNLIIASVYPHIFVVDQVNPAEGTVHLRDPDKTCDENGYWASAAKPWLYGGEPQPLYYSYALIKP